MIAGVALVVGRAVMTLGTAAGSCVTGLAVMVDRRYVVGGARVTTVAITYPANHQGSITVNTVSCRTCLPGIVRGTGIHVTDSTVIGMYGLDHWFCSCAATMAIVTTSGSKRPVAIGMADIETGVAGSQ